MDKNVYLSFERSSYVVNKAENLKTVAILIKLQKSISRFIKIRSAKRRAIENLLHFVSSSTINIEKLKEKFPQEEILKQIKEKLPSEKQKAKKPAGKLDPLDAQLLEINEKLKRLGFG